MAKPKVRAFRFELVLCVVTPIIVLLVIAIPGYLHIRNVKSEIQVRETLLDEIPVIESRLSVVRQLLIPYRVKNGGKDKIGELSQQVNKAAMDQGIKVKAVNAEKVVLAESPYSMDYRVSLGGEGGLVGMIRTMDALDQFGQCFKVASMRMRLKSSQPQPVYDAEWQFQYRYIPSKSGEAGFAGGLGPEQFKRLGVAMDAIKGFGKGKGSLLDTSKLENRNVSVAQETAPVAPEVPVSFKLHGVAEDGRGPLALTDRGVFGVGDSIDGYKIIKVEKDHIVVANRQGRREIVSLYTSESTP